MKERPILFSGPMVRALLDDSKTQTRRILKRQPYLSRTNPPHFSDVEVGDLFVCPDYFPTDNKRRSVIAECMQRGTYHCMGVAAFAEKHSPYGVAGDRLWVRETWIDLTGTGIERSTGDHSRYAYGADTPPGSYGDQCRKDYGLKWRPSIHMPRAASRITLEVTGVRVERLQDISETDSAAEGVESLRNEGEYWKHYLESTARCDALICLSARESFRTLWDSLAAPGADWQANPWVWVVEFKRAA